MSEQTDLDMCKNVMVIRCYSEEFKLEILPGLVQENILKEIYPLFSACVNQQPLI